MAQALFETLFDILYLTSMITAGILLFRKSGNHKLLKTFGLMAILLGAGDAFHLVPRIYALWTTGLEAHSAMLGIGKLITSLTMTLFYLLLYAVWRERYGIQGRHALTYTLLGLAALRILLCLLPQNRWTDFHAPLSWGILRNIPFALIGAIIIRLFYVSTRQAKDKAFWHMPLAVFLSFAFYIPVVLFSAQLPLIGMLMIPKTLAYVWIVFMGWRLYRQTLSTTQGKRSLR